MDSSHFEQNTRFQALEDSLRKEFSEGGAIFERTCRYLEKEMEHFEDRANPVVRRHMISTILPGYSCYRALADFGIGREEAISFIEAEICKSAKKNAELMGKLGKLPFAYAIMRLFIGKVVASSYPEGWTFEWGKRDGERQEVFITSCLYLDEFSKRGAPELGRAFCRTDHIVYEPLSPNIKFCQTGTIAKGACRCDFVFFNGRKQKED